MASIASSLLNGERVVVLLFLIPVLSSTPSSLSLEAIALSLLALSAFFVEIYVENSNALSTLKTRPGASSGILLGAITLPGVMFSKLIQLSRALPLGEVELEGFENIKFLCWTTSVCCFSVLVFVFLVLQPTGNGKHSLSSSSWIVKSGFISLILCAVMYFLMLPTYYKYGSNSFLKLLWVLGHGVATMRLIQHVLHTFPSCASIGEALLVTSGLVIYSGDMLRLTIFKIYDYYLSSVMRPSINRSEISIIIQGMVLGLLFFPFLFKFLLKIWDCFRSPSCSTATACNSVNGKSVTFFGLLAFTLIIIIPSWVQFVQDFEVHPWLWVLQFVFSEPVKRLSLCIYWMVVILVSVHRFYYISKNSKIERILLRKYYHLMAVSMFVPALILQPEFLNLAFGVALGIFLVVEIIRVWRIWPLGEFIHQFMNAFTDHRDSDILIISHFSLLLGCALPMWMSSGFNDRPLAPFAGILSLGIGDTMASMVGHKYGVLRWSKTGKKTIEGTAAGITSVLAACIVLLPLLASAGYILTQDWCSLLLAVTVSGLLEAYTAQLDNAFIPLVFYSLLSL